MPIAGPKWKISLGTKPHVALMALGIHGPKPTDRMVSTGHWWLHLYEYTANLRLNGTQLQIQPCCISLIPPGVEIEYDFIERSQHLCAHFTIPEGQSEGVCIPALQNLGDRFPEIHQAFEEAVAGFSVNQLRSEVRLWDILWQLTDTNVPGQVPHHSFPGPVGQVRELIELRLGEPLCVKDLAEEVGISHNQLTRLFRLSVNDTVIGYIRQRRVQRAKHFLEHTTLPIKTIAEQVGVEDPKFFYKMIREHLGVSPTEVRLRVQAPKFTADLK